MAGQLGDGRFILEDIKKEMHEVHNEMENNVKGPYKVKKRPYKVGYKTMLFEEDPVLKS
uniref:Uncharacterized protein n=1 Tax=Oryza meridionalis TaxID=40149 RepID=A0A0E0DLN0_9ORYZ